MNISSILKFRFISFPVLSIFVNYKHWLAGMSVLMKNSETETGFSYSDMTGFFRGVSHHKKLINYDMEVIRASSQQVSK